MDNAFGPDESQRNIYSTVGRSTIEDVTNGYNGTILAYGQTGSGKTYTMFGSDIYDEESKGIIPRAASDIFRSWDGHSEVQEIEINCSMLEIYKENLKDLLADETTELRIKESPDRGIYVEGLAEVPIASEDELMYWVDIGEERRVWAETRHNSVSSRSHALLMLEVKQILSNGTEKRGILNLVDLAGSEKVGKSGAQGQLFQEGTKINLSLSALGNVIHALTANLDHIPYRDSKLTRLLQESLGGNYKTTLIVTCSPHSSAMQESMSTLKFAQRAKKLKNRVKMNIKNSPGQLMKIIEQLREDLRMKEQQISRLAVSGGNDESKESIRQQRLIPPEELLPPASIECHTDCGGQAKQFPRSKSAQRFGMRLYISSGEGDSAVENRIVVNVNNTAKNSGDGDLDLVDRCREKEREIYRLRSQVDELNKCAEVFRKENVELNVKLKNSELSVMQEKKRVLNAEARIAELETQLAGEKMRDEGAHLKVESEGIQTQILANQNKALTEALEDAETECLKLLREKKEQSTKDAVELCSLSVIDYLNKCTIQTSVSSFSHAIIVRRKVDWRAAVARA
ncbi:MAG: hypothetical protein P4M11_09105 [Candidatus Pacebacteria bacterium]|nr:hypothetical protein [Candidatus Paceibacterota bacterium]